MPASYEMLPMFYANRRVSNTSKPAGFVDRVSAREMVEARLAEWTKGCKGIMLRKSQPTMHRPARSLKPFISVMDGYVAGDIRDVAIIEAWRFKCAA